MQRRDKSRHSLLVCLILTTIFCLAFLFSVVSFPGFASPRKDYVETETGKKYPIHRFNKPRGPNQLIVYTPAYGSSTGTNRWGAEVVVQHKVVQQIRVRQPDTSIPEDGYVLSGHGKAKEWLLANIEEGEKLTLLPATRPLVGVLISGYNMDWYQQMGMTPPHWNYFEATDKLIDFLRNLDYRVELISDKELKNAYGSQEGEVTRYSDFSRIKTLILPNTRRLSREECRNVRQFIEAEGTILATMEASYRDQEDRKVGSGGYQLSDLLKISFRSFSAEATEHAFIKKAKGHPVWNGIEGYIPNTEDWAELNKVKEGGDVLGVWVKEDKSGFEESRFNGAVVEGDRSIYLGGRFLDEAALANEKAKLFVENAIDYLYGMEIGKSLQREAQPKESRPKRSQRVKIIAGIAAVAGIIGYFTLLR